MRRKLRAVRPAAGEIAACDAHLALAMRAVTTPHNGEENDTHVIVRRLDGSEGPVCAVGGEPATWVLFPQAVLR